MSVTFVKNIKTKKECPYTTKVKEYIKIHMPLRNLDYNFRRKMVVELKSHPIEELTDETLDYYFKFKLAMPRTPYSKDVLEIAKKYHHKPRYTAENIYRTAKSICPTIADSTFYYWFERLGCVFSTSYDAYDSHIAIIIWYLAEIKQRSLRAKIETVK
jgi:hypothetical protein